MRLNGSDTSKLDYGLCSGEQDGVVEPADGGRPGDQHAQDQSGAVQAIGSGRRDARLG